MKKQKVATKSDLAKLKKDDAKQDKKMFERMKTIKKGKK